MEELLYLLVIMMDVSMSELSHNHLLHHFYVQLMLDVLQVMGLRWMYLIVVEELYFVLLVALNLVHCLMMMVKWVILMHDLTL